jgi:hypothetical protein
MQNVHRIQQKAKEALQDELSWICAITAPAARVAYIVFNNSICDWNTLTVFAKDLDTLYNHPEKKSEMKVRQPFTMEDIDEATAHLPRASDLLREALQPYKVPPMTNQSIFCVPRLYSYIPHDRRSFLISFAEMGEETTIAAILMGLFCSIARKTDRYVGWVGQNLVTMDGKSGNGMYATYEQMDLVGIEKFNVENAVNAYRKRRVWRNEEPYEEAWWRDMVEVVVRRYKDDERLMEVLRLREDGTIYKAHSSALRLELDVYEDKGLMELELEISRGTASNVHEGLFERFLGIMRGSVTFVK